MSNNPFSKAAKAKARLRMAIYGASGSGKTYSALSIGQSLGKMALIDTERGSASKYAGIFDFDVLELSDAHPKQYIDAIKAAGEAGYEVLIIDSLSHAWTKVLEMVDDITKRSQSKNSYFAWRDVTPLQNEFVDAMLSAPLHIIATMRSKTEYVLEPDRNGKTTPRKVGTTPIQRDGIEYEFDVVAQMSADNDFIVTKTRCPALNNATVNQPGADVGDILKAWLSDGVEMPVLVKKAPVEPEPPKSTVRGAGIKKQEPQPEPPSSWSDDETRWEEFLSSALDKFKFTSITVEEILGVFDGLGFADWRQSRGWALAALIADFCENDVTRIDEYTSLMAANGTDEKAALELSQKARQIAAAAEAVQS